MSQIILMGEFEVYVARFAHYTRARIIRGKLRYLFWPTIRLFSSIFSTEIYIHANYSRGFGRHKCAG